MASRKEQKERLRQERLQRERQAREAQRRRRLVGLGALAALALAAVVIGVVALVAGGDGDGEGGSTAELLPEGGQVPKQQITDLREAARAAGCTLRSTRAANREHVDRNLRYGTNPPTSGPHAPTPAADGAYGEAPPDTALVHSMEHGRVLLWFRPNLPKDIRATLKALFDKEKGFQLLAVPRRNMPFALAASAWGREPEPNGTGYLLGCPRPSDRSFDALEAFLQEHRGNGPEPVP